MPDSSKEFNMGLWGAPLSEMTPSRLAVALRSVDIDAALPFFLVPLALAVGSICFTATVLVMIVLTMSLLYVMQRPRPNNRTQFFFTWTISSAFFLFLVFELDVLTMLEITQEENLAFLALLVSGGWCLHRVRSVADPDRARGKDYSPVLTADSLHCAICQIEVNNRYFHSVWLDSCISTANYRYYLAGLCLADLCLVYASYLGLTTVCQPYIVFENILMPEDCSDVYFDFDLALCFMSCAYSLGYAFAITMILIHQCIKYLPRYIRQSFKRSANELSA